MTDAKKSEILTSIADSVRSITDSDDKVSLTTLPEKLAARDAELELFRYIEGKLGTKTSLVIPEKYTSLKCSFAGSKLNYLTANGFNEIPTAFCMNVMTSSSGYTVFRFPNAEIIKGYAFSLARIHLASDFTKVKSIDGVAFDSADISSYYGGNKCFLTDEFLPSLEKIEGKYSFRNAKGLSLGVSHSKIKSIGHGCFEGSDVVTVSFPKLTDCGSYAFRNCVKLTDVDLPLWNKSGVGSYGFKGCSSLKRLELPLVASPIGEECFAGCSSLTDLIFGGNSKTGMNSSGEYTTSASIGKNCVLGCDKLKAIVFRNQEVPPKMVGLYFDNSPVTDGDCYIYVPDSAVSAYKAATNWSVYADRIKKLSEYNG